MKILSDQHFGLDLPENVGTFRIVGVVRDAKFAGFGSPTRAPMFYVPLAQNVDYKDHADDQSRIAVPFHRRIMLLTNASARRYWSRCSPGL